VMRWWGRFLFGGDRLPLLFLDKPALTPLFFLGLGGRSDWGAIRASADDEFFGRLYHITVTSKSLNIVMSYKYSECSTNF
jgi:hypothetical protein